MSNRLHISEKILSIATRIRPGEGAATLMLIGNAFLLLYSHLMLKVVRDTLILTHGTALDKSMMNAVSALTIGIAVSIYGVFYKHFKDNSHRYDLTLMVNGFFIVSIFIFMGFLFIDISNPYVFYVWQSIYGVLLISHFWSYCADVMNQKTGQRLFPPIMIGASLGAWAGASSSDWVFNQAGLYSVLMLALSCLLLATYFSKNSEVLLPDESKNHLVDKEDREEHFSAFDGFRLIFSKRYLTYIAAFVLLTNWIQSTGEYIFSSYLKELAAQLATENPGIRESEIIAEYWSTFHTWVSLCSFLIQTFLVSRLFQLIGINGSVMVLPIILILGFSTLAMAPMFLLVQLIMIASISTINSIANTTKNALYLPLAREEKYVAKTTIDTFVFRLGDLVQFGAIFLGTKYFLWQIYELIWLNLLLSVLMLIVCFKISRTYKNQYEQVHIGTAPQLIGEIAPYELCSGWKMRGKIPEDIFYDPDPGDALKYFLTTIDNKKLPRWILFDRHNLHITFTPPAGTSGELSLKLRVTDADELGCEAEFDVRWSDNNLMSDHLEKI